MIKINGKNEKKIAQNDDLSTKIANQADEWPHKPTLLCATAHQSHF